MFIKMNRACYGVGEKENYRALWHKKAFAEEGISKRRQQVDISPSYLKAHPHLKLVCYVLQRKNVADGIYKASER